MAAKVGDGLISFAIVVLGLILMATPLALWVAWSKTVLLVVLATGIAAGVLICVLVRFERPDPSLRRRSRSARPGGLPQVGLVRRVE